MSFAEQLNFERISPLRRVIKACLVNPLANYLPAGVVKGILRFGKSELATSNWKDPGGWRSMVISYEGNPRQFADKILVNAGTMSMALRNRRKLAAAILANLMNKANGQPVHVLCLGAGPGHIITDAMKQAHSNVNATLIDLSSDAFDYGRSLASRNGLADRVQYIKGDVCNLPSLLGPCKVDLVKMLGICEYLSDSQIVEIVQAVSARMPADSHIVFNTLSLAHGTDRFFRRVFGLNMIHRNAKQLQALIAQGGIGQFEVVPEPLGVYHVVTGKKLQS